jgi:hypothetical protein
MIVLEPRVVVDVQQALPIFQHHNQQEDKIRPLVENYRCLKECCRKKNHGDEDAGAGVYNLIVDQSQQTPQEARREGIVGTMNLMVTLEVDDEVLAVAVLSELTSMVVYRVT